MPRGRVGTLAKAEYDVIVIGVGGMGSATVYELAKRGRNVLGLERFGVPNAYGSSHGVNRIIRLAYYEHPSYVPLLRRAYELWDEIEQRCGRKLRYTTGSIDAGAEDSEVFSGSLESCRIHDLRHEVLTARELGDRFPGYDLPADHLALFQPEGGFLASEECISRYAAAAVELGAEVRSGVRVQGWTSERGTNCVITDSGRYSARSIVLTAGAWTGELLPVLREKTMAERQVLGWFTPLDSQVFQPDSFPVFNLAAEEGRFYGFPEFGVAGFKIGRYHHLRQIVDPDRIDREVHEEDEDVLRMAIEKYFPNANGAALDLKTCMFTNSPDEHFVIDSVPGQPGVAFAAGFSGHGFKFCSIVGEVLADLVLEGETTHDIEMFRLSRL